MKMTTSSIRQNSTKAWLIASRPKTLSGAAVPVLIGLAQAYTDSKQYQGDCFSWTAAAICMIFALLMQIDANLINDFFDYTKGTDDNKTRLGPPRACAQGWVSPRAMKHAIAMTTCLACACGLPLVFFGGLEMILVGVVCVVFCFLYTTHLSYIGLGDLLVVIFFGIVPVCITYYIQLHTCTWQVFIGSLACGIAIDALLLVNNFRDRFTDRTAGKNTLAVKLGERKTLQLYLATGCTAFLMGCTYWAGGHPMAFLFPFAYLALHILTYTNIARIRRGKELNVCLGQTARNILVYGLTVTIGLLL